MHGKRRSGGNQRRQGRQSPNEVAPQEEGVGTPTKRVRLNVAEGTEEMTAVSSAVVVGAAAATRRVVTPGTAVATSSSSSGEEDTLETAETTTTLGDDNNARTVVTPSDSPARRSLFTPPSATQRVLPLPQHSGEVPNAKRRLLFGREVTLIPIQKNVRKVYKIVHRLTGTLGGNASSGPIYGELTMGSMQKMINLMKEHTGLCETSRFIDVGSGIGKPNLHVAQDPGVAFSYGLEVEESRWLLGMTCLKGVLEAAVDQESSQAEALGEDERIRHRCYFEKGDIRQAKSFAPFSHVYMFSIGFPPKLWIELAKIWNRSTSPYMICYHGPKDIIETYEFDVELITQKPTSMHGSKEGHTGYIYKRMTRRAFDTEACDPLFKTAFNRVVQTSAAELNMEVGTELDQMQGTGPSTRASRRRDA